MHLIGKLFFVFFITTLSNTQYLDQEHKEVSTLGNNSE